MNTFYTQASITVLYLLCHSNISLTVEQIADALASVTDYTYMDVVVGLENLSDNEYVVTEEKINGCAYLPTVNGRMTLERLKTSLRASVRNKLIEYVKDNFHALSLQSNISYEARHTDTGKSRVILRAFDKDMDINDIILTVSDSDQAAVIMKNWSECADDVIAKIYEMLLKDI